MIYIGIDPGESGAVTAIWDDGEPATQFHKLSEPEQDLVSYLKQFDLKSARCVVESVHSMSKQGVASSFKFGKSFGFCLGILTGLQIPFKLVTPQTWQKAMKCLTKGNKNVSKRAAQQLWPTLKITHANAESLLIAEYGRTVAWK